METRQIAIIGGGIAGLSAAYYLHGRISGDGTTTYACTVYDISHRLGGNCYISSSPTIWLVVGRCDGWMGLTDHTGICPARSLRGP